MKSLLLFLSLIIINSCASPPDVWGCRARSVNEGFCTKSISRQSQIVTDESPLKTDSGLMTWLDIKIQSVYLPAESWAKFKEYTIKMCKKYNECGDIGQWTSKIDSITP